MTDAPHVIIVGAGFAGLSAVGRLRKAGARVTIIDRNLYSTFQPLLYQVATGGLNPCDIAYTVGGFTARRGIRYTRADSIILRDHIISCFERLSAEPDSHREFDITVVGGGATGVELAGTLGELCREVLHATFPDVDPSRVHVQLVEMAPALLMPFQPRLREYTRKQLAARGVDIRLDTRILEVLPDRVVLGDGQSLPSDLTVWAAGVAAPRPVAGWNLPQGPGGRIVIGPDLRVQGEDRIFAVGDIAIYPDEPSPQLAQPALQEGKHAAAQIVRLQHGEPTEPFSYHDKGIMATIGRRSAVVQLGRGARITGTLAWLAWLALHLLYLLGGRNRVSTVINLSWRYIAWGHAR